MPLFMSERHVSEWKILSAELKSYLQRIPEISTWVLLMSLMRLHHCKWTTSKRNMCFIKIFIVPGPPRAKLCYIWTFSGWISFPLNLEKWAPLSVGIRRYSGCTCNVKKTPTSEIWHWIKLNIRISYYLSVSALWVCIRSSGFFLGEHLTVYILVTEKKNLQIIRKGYKRKDACKAS